MRLVNLFSAGSTRVRLHPAFIALVVAMALLGDGVRAALLFAAVLIHELAHIASARRLGITTYEVVLMPFGGVAHLDESGLVDPAAETRVAFAGPAVNLLLGGALAAASVTAMQGGTADAASPSRAVLQVLGLWGWDHLGLGLFNLLPVFPLDGGRLVRAAAARRMGFRAATRLVGQAGEIAGAVMALAGGIWYSRFGHGLGAMVMGLFLLYAARMERRRAPGTWIRYLERTLSPVRQAPVEEGRLLVARSGSTVKDVALRLVPGRYHVVFITDSRGRVMGLTGEREVIEALIERGLTVPVTGVPYRRM